MPLINPSSNTSQPFFSQANSSFNLLGVNEAFVGEWEDISTFASLSTMVRTDQLGTLNYQYSMDGIVVDRQFNIPITDLEEGTYNSSGPRARYFRVKYTNGPVAQTVFRLNCYYSPVVVDDAHSPVGQGVSSRSNSLVTRAVLFGKTPTNTYTPLKVAVDGTLPINLDPSALKQPVMLTNKYVTSEATEDQVVLSYTTTTAFSLHGFSMFVWDTMQSSSVVFGECSLESPPGKKLYTAQLSSLNQGTHSYTASVPLIFTANRTIRIVCSPSGPINEQTWQANLIGAA